MFSLSRGCVLFSLSRGCVVFSVTISQHSGVTESNADSHLNTYLGTDHVSLLFHVTITERYSLSPWTSQQPLYLGPAFLLALSGRCKFMITTSSIIPHCPNKTVHKEFVHNVS